MAEIGRECFVLDSNPLLICSVRAGTNTSTSSGFARTGWP